MPPPKKTILEKKGEISFPNVVSDDAQGLSTPSPQAALPASVQQAQTQDGSAPVNTSSPIQPVAPVQTLGQATGENPEGEPENFTELFRASADHPVTPEDKHQRYVEALSRSPASQVHNNWVPVYAHTGKCDECDKNKHNMLQRCKPCNHHLCRNCIEGRRYKLNHWADLKELDWSPKEPDSEAKSSGKKSVGRPRKMTSGTAAKKPRHSGKAGSGIVKDAPPSFEIGAGTKSAAGSSRVVKSAAKLGRSPAHQSALPKLVGSSGSPKKRVSARDNGPGSSGKPEKESKYESFEEFLNGLPENMKEDPSWRQIFSSGQPFEPTRPSSLSKEQAHSQIHPVDEVVNMIMVDGELRKQEEIEGLFDSTDDSDQADEVAKKPEEIEGLFDSTDDSDQAEEVAKKPGVKAVLEPAPQPASVVVPQPRRPARETAMKPANRDAPGSSSRLAPVRRQHQQPADEGMTVPMGFPGISFGGFGGSRQVAPPNSFGLVWYSEMNDGARQPAHHPGNAFGVDSMAMPDQILARGEGSRRNGPQEQNRIRFTTDETFRTMIRNNLETPQLSPPSPSRPSAPFPHNATPSPLPKMVPSIGSTARQGPTLAEMFAQVERKHAEEEARKKAAENAAKLAALEEECQQLWNTNAVVLEYRNRGQEDEARELLKTAQIMLAMERGITLPQD